MQCGIFRSLRVGTAKEQRCAAREMMSHDFMSDCSFLPLTSFILIPCQSNYLLHRSNGDKTLDVPFLFSVYITCCNGQKLTWNEK